MLLSKKDIKNIVEAIRPIIREELNSALNRTIAIERGARKQGDLEKVVKEEEWNVFDFLLSYAPLTEASLRGMQEDVSKTKNKIDLQNEKIEAIGNVLIGMENSALKLANASDKIKNIKLIDIDNESNIE